MDKASVLVVGAGPTGMALAIELKRAGLDVRLIDKADHQALHSQALVVQARTLEQFQRYGIAAQTVEQGRKLTRAQFWSDDKCILSFPFERIPSRYPYLLLLPQNKTEAILNSKLESLGLRVERKTELVSITQNNGAATAILRGDDGQEETVRPRWIVGCDGAHSTIRQQSGISFEGGGVGLSFFLGDLELEGPAVPEDELSLHLHAGDVVFMGRLSEQYTRIIVALHSQQGETSDRPVSLSDFQDAVDRAKVRVKVRSADWMTPFHVTDLQAKHYRAGNLFLAGDAAHIHSPVGGQGMNTGIQDAANLAWKLAAVARGGDEKLLNSYEEERGVVGKALLRFTERGLKMATTANYFLECARDALLPLVAHSKAVQDALVGFISETGIEYKSSSIVADCGGDGSLKAGERMPDLELPDEVGGATLLSNWTDGRHLALLFNGMPEDAADVAARLPQARVIPISAADLDEEGIRVLGVERKLVILRPDGYVGFRGPLSKITECDAYARQDGLQQVFG